MNMNIIISSGHLIWTDHDSNISKTYRTKTYLYTFLNHRGKINASFHYD
jgi:hypothetical protein